MSGSRDLYWLKISIKKLALEAHRYNIRVVFKSNSSYHRHFSQTISPSEENIAKNRVYSLQL